LFSFTNSESYPFNLTDEVYSSTNKDGSSDSTFTITALKDYELEIQYKTSTEKRYDVLTISQNLTVKVTDSGTDDVWKTATLNLTKGDRVYINYSKDSSVSKGEDTIYFKLVLPVCSTDEVEPTCEDSVICDVCGEVVKAAIGHNFEDNFTTDKESTKLEEGSKSRHCSVCNAKTDITIIPKLNAEFFVLIKKTLFSFNSYDATSDINLDGSNDILDLIKLKNKLLEA